MSSRTLVFPLLFALLAGCGSSSNSDTAPTPLPAQATPGIQAVTPAQIFRGRDAVVAVQGIATSFGDGSRVVASDPSVKVTAVHAISPVGLSVSLYVPATVAAASLDLDVDGLPAKGALTLAEAVEITPPHGRFAQGGTLAVHLTNHDAAHPLDGLRIAIDGGKGITASITNVSAGAADLALSAAPDAATGAHDLSITLTPDTTPTSDAGSDAAPTSNALTTILGSAFLIDPGAVATLPTDAATNVVIPAGAEGATLRLVGSGGKLVDVQVLKATNDAFATVTPLLELVDPTLGRARPLSQMTGSELLAIGDTGDPLLFVGTLAGGGTTTVSLLAHLESPAKLPEIEPNETLGTATAIGAPAIVTATLGEGDADVFSIPTAGKTLVVRTAPTTSGATVDTVLEVLDDAGTVVVASDDEDPAANDYFSFLAVPKTSATTRVRVRVGSNLGIGGDYRLFVVVR